MKINVKVLLDTVSMHISFTSTITVHIHLCITHICGYTYTNPSNATEKTESNIIISLKRSSYDVIIMNSFMNSTEEFSTCIKRTTIQQDSISEI